MNLIYAQGHDNMSGAAALTVAGHVSMPTFERKIVDGGATKTQGFRHFTLRFDVLSDADLITLLDETGVDESTPSTNCTIVMFDERGVWRSYNAICTAGAIERDRKQGAIDGFTLEFTRMEAL